jgi:hypothetical protein
MPSLPRLRDSRALSLRRGGCRSNTDVPRHPNHRSRAARASRLLFMAAALGEICVGAALLFLPANAIGLLLKAALSGASLVVARLLGIALIALGLTWWWARRAPAGLRWRTVGFLAYNLGIGLLLLLLAFLAGPFAAVLWLVAWLHLLTGLGFALGAPVRSSSS